MGFKVWILGVGDESVLPTVKLAEWSTNNSAWNLNNWQDFKRDLEMLKEQQDEEAASEDQKLNIDIYPQSTNIKFGESIPLKLILRPVHSKDVIPRGTKIIFDQKDRYFDPLDSLKYTLPSGKQIMLTQSGKIKLPTGLMRGEFVTDYPINVLMFGQRGKGKSATTSTLTTSFSQGCLSIESL